MVGVVAVLTAQLAIIPCTVRAQGGPPLVTDDPDTPGAGRWEINLAAIAMQTTTWLVAVPDADLNYGWGDHLQLKADIPFVVGHATGDGWSSGLGTSLLGVKWRFVDRDASGFAMSVYPQYSSGWVASSRRHNLALAGHEFFLPLEAATQSGGFALDAEVGRNFVVNGASQWMVGAIVGHACSADIECLVELRDTISPGDQQTLVNLGMHWRLSESLALLGAAGRSFGPAAPSQQRLLVYLGLQFRH